MHPFLRSKFTTMALAVVMLWMLVIAIAAGMRRHGLNADLQLMQSNIDDAKRENARLAQEFEHMQQPQWLALLARQRLNYKLPDETVVFVYKSEKAGTIAPPQESVEVRPNWRKWLEWLRGRRE